MSNSNLVVYKKLSPNKTSPRTHAIDTITIHCMAGNLSVEACGNMFAKAENAVSSNYGIGSDGRIAMYVEEKNRSWCSSNRANDHRAITIEVANDGGASTGWHVSDKAMTSLIELVTDICKRNNIKELKWKADKSLIGRISEQNMTVHRWFANKSCPGDYLYNKHSYIATEVNKRLNPSSDSIEEGSSVDECAIGNLKLTGSTVNVRSGAGTKSKILTTVKKGSVYPYVETKKVGNITWYKIMIGNSKSGWICGTYAQIISSASATNSKLGSYKVKITASALNVREGAGTSYKISTVVKKNQVYTIVAEKNGWGKLKSGAGWINLKYTSKI